MSNTPSEFTDHGERPTEELYIELRDLEAMETRMTDEDGTPEATFSAATDDTSGIRERIAHLRALLSDRGVIRD